MRAMTRNLVGLIAATIVLMSGQLGAAAEPPQEPDVVAREVVSAFQAKDSDRLRELAAQEDLDAWLIADALCAMDAHDAALALAAAATGADIARLREHIGGHVADPERPRVLKAEGLLAAGRNADVLVALTVDNAPKTPFLLARHTFTRGHALRNTGNLAESVAAFDAAAAAAKSIGWLRRESKSYHEAGVSAYYGGALAVVRDRWLKRKDTDTKRGDDRGVVRALGNMGLVFEAMGDVEGAAAAYEESRKRSHELGDVEMEVAALENAGLLHMKLEHWDEATECLEAALALEIRHELHADEAGTHVNLANLFSARGLYPEALEHGERAVDMMRGQGADERRLAAALLNKGEILSRLSRHTEALPVQREALELHLQIGDVQNIGSDLLNLGVSNTELGEYESALGYYERALEHGARTNDQLLVAQAHGNRGNTCFAMGRIADALADQESALAIKRRIGDPGGVARTLMNAASIHHSIGDPTAALELLQQALDAGVDHLRPEMRAYVLSNRGVILERVERFSDAMAAYKAALDAVGDDGDPGVRGRAFTGIGSVATRMGDFDVARTAMNEGIALFETIDDPAALLTVRMNLAGLALAQNRLDVATTKFEAELAAAKEMGAIPQLLIASLGLTYSHLNAGNAEAALKAALFGVDLLPQHVSGLSDRQGALLRGEVAPLFVAGATAALDADDKNAFCHLLETGRAGALLEAFGAREALLGAVLPPDLRVEDVAARRREARALKEYAAARRDRDKDAIRSATAELNDARDARGNVVDRIQRTARSRASVAYPNALDIPALQARLSKSQALVLYAALDPHLAALVLTPSSARLVRAGAMDSVREACAALRLDSAKSNPSDAVAVLRSAVIEPLGLDDSVTTLIVSPDGPLAFAPFALLAGDRHVVLVPSGTTMSALEKRERAAGKGVLALGDPDYTSFGTRVLLRGRRFGSLPRLTYSGKEAEAIGTTVLVGEKASEDALRAELARETPWRAVHLACHGFVDAEQPLLSCVVVAPGKREDGLLTALDVMGLDVRADLVVLSACETGLGKYQSGEGVMGLARAFLIAGAPRLLVSLWRADDEATRALMGEFHKRWNAGASVTEALALAQASVRKQERWSHPHYWAGWTLWGLPD